MAHSRDTFLNGFITGIATPILFYFIWTGISYILSNYIIDNWSGFSDKFLFVASVVANALPVYFYNKYESNNAMRGLVGVTLLMVMGVVFYFWEDFLR